MPRQDNERHTKRAGDATDRHDLIRVRRVLLKISESMTVIGATSNPLVGFTLPIVFYLKMNTLRGRNT